MRCGYTLTEPEKVKFHTITNITPGGRHKLEDILLREESWALYANGTFIIEFNCLPFNLKQLAAGHLYCRHRLRHKSQIDTIDLDNAKKRILVKIRDTLALASFPEMDTIYTAEEIHFLQHEFSERCHLYRETGAAHSCALANRSGIEIYFEDVARHNSLDKVIGEMVLQNVSPEGKALVFSGRLASDMLEKAAASGIKVLIAPGAPSSAAVSLAEKHRITLMGFVRPDNINIYTHPERVAQNLPKSNRQCNQYNKITI